MRTYFVACVDMFGVCPPIEECDEVQAKSAAAAAEIIHRSLNDDSDTFFHVQVFAVARNLRPFKWEHIEITATVSYSAKAVDMATASKAAAA